MVKARLTIDADEDIYAKNTLAEKERVGLRLNKSVRVDDGVTSVILRPSHGLLCPSSR